MYNIIALLVLVSLTNARDITVGSDIGKKIFDENFQASPAIWRQIQNVTINTTDDEVIGRIIVKDLRAEKDGDVNIVDGGEGQKKVTLELKSPTVLRGYDFHVEVYAISNSEARVNGNVKKTDDATHPSQVGVPTNLPEIPKVVDPNFAQPRTDLEGTTKGTESKIKNTHGLIPTDTVDDKDRKTRDTINDTKKQDVDISKIKHPSIAAIETKTTEAPARNYGENEKSDGSDNLKPRVTEIHNNSKVTNEEERYTRGTENKTDNDKSIMDQKLNNSKLNDDDETAISSSKTLGFIPLNNDKKVLPPNYPTSAINDRNARETHIDSNITPASTDNKNNHMHTSTPNNGQNIPVNSEKDVPSTFGLKTNIEINHNVSKIITDEKKDEKQNPNVFSRNNKTGHYATNEKERIVRDTHENKNKDLNVPRTLSTSIIFKNNENEDQSETSSTPKYESVSKTFNGQNRNSNPTISTAGTTVNPAIVNKETPQEVFNPTIKDSVNNKYKAPTSNPFPQAHGQPIPYPYNEISTTPKSEHKRDAISTIKEDSEKDNKLTPILLSEGTTKNVESSTIKVSPPRVKDEPYPQSSTPKSEHKRESEPTERNTEINQHNDEKDLRTNPKLFGSHNTPKNARTPVISIQ
ncbi:uncharacterized protein ACR2FA_007544 [Aphomia sociella]